MSPEKRRKHNLQFLLICIFALTITTIAFVLRNKDESQKVYVCDGREYSHSIVLDHGDGIEIILSPNHRVYCSNYTVKRANEDVLPSKDKD